MKTTIVIFLFLAFAPFVFGGNVLVENHVTSSANTGGNSAVGGSDGASGGTIVTGSASTQVEVAAKTNDGGGSTKVDVTATANGETKTVSEEFEGDGSVEVNVKAVGSGAATSVSVENVSIMRTPALDSKSKINIAVGEFISALKNFFSYVVSIFKRS
ncbi:MAG: hypothetical protein AAB912_00685 [Patescibacteria group bacterium]|mgnify:FL=1